MSATDIRLGPQTALEEDSSHIVEFDNLLLEGAVTGSAYMFDC